MLEPTYRLPNLPPPVELETAPIMKALAKANRALGELKGRAAAIPNQGILINTLVLQEARASSEIENIVTTQEEIFRAELFPDRSSTAAVREVARYREALRHGYDLMRGASDIISNNTLIEMFRRLMSREGGFRTTLGTVLRNDRSGETIYVPPQSAHDIVALMGALETFINEDEACPLDPLIKMAVIHHQFESIHPFPDGNGRIGRMLCVLYLVRCELLEIPILHLSRHITRTKDRYYRYLQAVRDTDGSQEAWRNWVLYMLEGVAATAEATFDLVEGMRTQMAEAKSRIRGQTPRIYSHELLNNLFGHPHTRIDFMARDLGVNRQTATKYLDMLTDIGLLEKQRAGRNNYYVNTRLVELFLQVSASD